MCLLDSQPARHGTLPCEALSGLLLPRLVSGMPTQSCCLSFSVDGLTYTPADLSRRQKEKGFWLSSFWSKHTYPKAHSCPKAWTRQSQGLLILTCLSSDFIHSVWAGESVFGLCRRQRYVNWYALCGVAIIVLFLFFSSERILQEWRCRWPCH